MNEILVRTAEETQLLPGNLIALAAAIASLFLTLGLAAWFRMRRQHRIEVRAWSEHWQGVEEHPGVKPATSTVAPPPDPINLQPGEVILQQPWDASPSAHGSLIIVGPQPSEGWAGLLWWDGKVYRLHDGDSWMPTADIAKELGSLRRGLEERTRQLTVADAGRQRLALEVVEIGRALGIPEAKLAWGPETNPARACADFAGALRRCALALVELERQHHEQDGDA